MLKTYKYKVDFSKVTSPFEIHEILKRDLEFPDYYGGNLDALWDCLTDMLGGINYIEIHGFENIKNKFPERSEKIYSVFKDVKHAYNDRFFDRFFVTLVNADGARKEVK